MRGILRELFRDIDHPKALIFMDEQGIEKPRQYLFTPRTIVLWSALAVLGLILLVFCFIAFTPVREIIPGYGTTEIRENAEKNSLRLAALEDSLQLQSAYLEQLRGLITGEVSEVEFPPLPPAQSTTTTPVAVANGQTDRAQTATRFVNQSITIDNDNPSSQFLASPDFPTLPPVEGFLTRGFDASSGHFASDVAVPEGTTVRAIADGQVVFADWTHDGGNALAIQHASGYLSIYKHNQRLLRQLGDRVRGQEPVAISGNTGEVTTGPHLHFELWQNGVPRDPSTYVVTW